jgi:hypothetical protein
MLQFISHKNRWLLLLSLTMALLHPGETLALDSDPSEPTSPHLFMTAENVDDIQARQSPTIIRSRLVNIDFSLLSDPEDNDIAKPEENNTDESESEIELILNLFHDIEFTTLIQKTEKNRSGSYSWYGKLKDIPLSQVVLVVNKGTVYGQISKPNFTYQIRHITNGVHAVYKIDPSKFPPDGEPIAPSSTPIDNLKKEEDGALEPVPQNSTLPLNQDQYSKSGIETNTDISSSLGMSPSETQSDDGTVVDILVVYTAEARAAEGGTSSMESLIDLSISLTNAIYSNSGVNHILRLVGQQEISFSESGFSFNGFLNSAISGAIPGLSTLRDTVGADLVAVLVEGDNSLCGIAGLMETVSSSFAPFAYSVTQTDCTVGNLTMAHEIGHNMAARHDRANDNTNGSPFDYNHGFVDNTNNFRTVMGTGNNTRIQFFSNPNLSVNGAAIGIAEGNALAADNRLTFQNTALTVANFRQAIDSPTTPAFDSIVPFSNSKRVVSPYWQSDDSSYSFISVTHPSLSNMASQVGIIIRAIKNDGSLFGSTKAFTIDSSATKRVFIVRSAHPTINSTSLTDVELITGSSIFQNGFLHLNPVASNPEISVGGFRDITMLSFWGAIVIETNTTGFAMEFIGDTHDSAATASMASSSTVSGVN